MSDVTIKDLTPDQRDKAVDLMTLTAVITDDNGQKKTVGLNPKMAFRLAQGGKYPAQGLKPHVTLQVRIAEILEVSDFSDLVEETEGAGNTRVSRETIQLAKDLFGKKVNTVLAQLFTAIQESTQDPMSVVSDLIERAGEIE